MYKISNYFRASPHFPPTIFPPRAKYLQKNHTIPPPHPPPDCKEPLFAILSLAYAIHFDCKGTVLLQSNSDYFVYLQMITFIFQQAFFAQ